MQRIGNYVIIIFGSFAAVAELAALFTDKGYTLSAMDKDELRDRILNIDEFHPVEFVSSNKKINKLVIDFIEGI